jgi:excisionase family DNA binding protein
MVDASAVQAPAVMTIAEVAEYLRIPRGSIYKLAQQGRIPCQKVGKHWRFRREAVDAWLDNGHERDARPSGRLGGRFVR